MTKTDGAIAAIHSETNADVTRPTEFLIRATRQFPQFLRRVVQRIRLSKHTPLLLPGETTEPESLLYGFQIAEIEALQFTTCNPHQSLRTA